MKITKAGIKFSHSGDEVIYIFPWKRRGYSKSRYYSVLFDSYFKSLKELDKTWDDYAKLESETRKQEDIERQHNWVYVEEKNGGNLFRCSKCGKEFITYVTISGSWNDHYGFRYCYEEIIDPQYPLINNGNCDG